MGVFQEAVVLKVGLPFASLLVDIGAVVVDNAEDNLLINVRDLFTGTKGEVFKSADVVDNFSPGAVSFVVKTPDRSSSGKRVKFKITPYKQHD